ncbi:DUF6299 family protein [Humibacillus xanthopallidus]|uniref:DUF6299 family protein n=1 Tax=Humibacillus xanthopallidus TaxID=412689 RepID=UPI00384B0D08
MRLTTRWGAAAVATITGLVLSGAPALAAAPGNDTSGSPDVIGSLPYSATIITSDATTDADDAQLNPDECGAPATDASVWFTVTAPADGYLAADVSDSNYSAGVSVGQGTPGALTWLTCGSGGTAFEVVAGQTYTILAFDDQLDEAGNGGTLQITVDVAPPPPTIDVTVDPVGQFDSATGGAYLSGTVTCDEGADLAFVDLQLTQRVGRLLIRGYGGTEAVCTGEPEPWTVFITGDNGTFKGGKAVNVTVGVACNVTGCGEYLADQTVQLKGRKS